MTKFKLIAAMLAILMAVTMTSAPASAGYYGYMKHKHHHHHHHMKKVKSTSGHHHHHLHGSTVVVSIIVCAGGVVTAALIANFQQYRELTASEAAGCGLPFFLPWLP